MAVVRNLHLLLGLAFVVAAGCGTPNTPAAPAGSFGSPSMATAGNGYGYQPPSALTPPPYPDPNAGSVSTLIATDSGQLATDSTIISVPTTGATPAANGGVTYTLQKGSTGFWPWSKKETATVTVVNQGSTSTYAYLQVTFTSNGTAVETQPQMPEAIPLGPGATQVATFSATADSNDVAVSLNDTLF